MKKIILVGNSVTAEVLRSYLLRDTRYEVVGLAVDDEFLDKSCVEGLTAVGLSSVKNAFSPDTHRVLMAVGYNDLNRVRESLFDRVKGMGYTVETYVHPAAHIFTDYPLGEGCVILPSAVVEPDVRIGANSMIWCNVTLAHHSVVGEHCWIAAGTVVSGRAKVMRNTFVGVNATVVNEVTIGEYNIVGAAAMVSKDTKPRTVHLARSAEPFRYSSDDYVKFFGV